MSSNVHTFYADAVLFDMDGTLTDSIAAVEAAWGKVAKDIGQDPAYVIAATHGKRAVDNLAQFKPSIRAHEMDAEVQKFEESILFFADAHRLYGPGTTDCPSFSPSSLSPISSEEATPELVGSPASSLPSSRASSFVALGSRRPSFASRLNGMLSMTAVPESSIYDARFTDSLIVEEDEGIISFEADPRNNTSWRPGRSKPALWIAPSAFFPVSRR